MLRWLARLAVVLLGAAAFTLSVTVASAHPTRAPHPNPHDLPPSTVAGGGPDWLVGVAFLGGALIAAYAIVALWRRRTT